MHPVAPFHRTYAGRRTVRLTDGRTLGYRWRQGGRCLKHSTGGLIAAALLAFCASTRAAVFEADITDADGKPLEDAVISLNVDGQTAASPTQPATMDQRGLQFVPHVLVVQRGAAVAFPNSDQVRHHVYSFSPAKKFELRLYKSIPAEPVIFDQAGVATLGCNIHDWMLGYVVVVDTPWFGKSAADGHLRIDDVPAGDYQLQVWHARAIGDPEADGERVHLGNNGMHRAFTIATSPPPTVAPPTELELKFRAYRKQLPDDA